MPGGVSHKHVFQKYPEYISALPAEDLIKVGMTKQDMYNQGVSQIDEQLNKLGAAGLELVKTPDKEYFVQEMNKATKAINDSAGVDFSNINNVRNVRGIGAILENDQTLLNGLAATSEFRRRQSTLSKMDPKSRGASNDWTYMRDAEAWYNDGKAGSSLGFKEYTPYMNINAKIGESISKHKPEIREKIRRENGLISIQTLEEMTDQRVQQIILSELDENERNQLRMDSEFDLHKAGPERVQEKALNSFDKRLNAANASIEYQQGLSDYYRKAYAQTKDLSMLSQAENAEAGLKEAKVAKDYYSKQRKSFEDINNVSPESYYPVYFSEYLTDKSAGWAYSQTTTKIQNDQIYAINLNHQYSLQRDHINHAASAQLEMYKAKVAKKQAFIDKHVVEDRVDLGLSGDFIKGITDSQQYLSGVASQMSDPKEAQRIVDLIATATKNKTGAEQLKAISAASNAIANYATNHKEDKYDINFLLKAFDLPTANNANFSDIFKDKVADPLTQMADMISNKDNRDKLYDEGATIGSLDKVNFLDDYSMFADQEYFFKAGKEASVSTTESLERRTNETGEWLDSDGNVTTDPNKVQFIPNKQATTTK